MHVICSGNTKPFSSQFAQVGFQLKTRENGTPYSDYFRVMPNVELRDRPAALEIFKLLAGSKCLDNSPAIVRVASTEADATHVQEFLEDLKVITCWRIEI